MALQTYTAASLDPARVAAILSAAGFELGPPVRVRRTVLDSFDGRLHGAGLRLELHEAGPARLVLTGAGAVPAEAAAGGAPRLATDLPPGPLRARLAPVLDVRALLPLLVVAGTARLARRRDGAGKVRATVVLYEQAAVEGAAGAARPGPAWGAELHPAAGRARDAERAARLLASAGLEARAGGVTDLVAAAAGVDLGGTRLSPAVEIDRHEPALAAFRRVLANLAATVEANRPGTVADLDSEFLHDLRVAVRRTRSVLAHGRQVLPAEVAAAAREGFGWLGEATSAARDLDVWTIEWDAYTAPLPGRAGRALAPVVEEIGRRRAAAHGELAAVLAGPRYRELLAWWRAWLDGPPVDPGGPKGAAPAGAVAARCVRRAQERLLARGRAVTAASPAEDLHELRKDAKRLRYALECLATVFDPGATKAFVRRLKALQDNLGEHQDAEVHAAQLAAIARHLHGTGAAGPDALVAVGQLTEHLDRRRRAARQGFARRFAAYDTGGTARALATAIGKRANRVAK